MKFGTYIHGPQRMTLIEFGDPEFSSSTIMRLTFVVQRKYILANNTRIVIQFARDIQGPQRINSNEFSVSPVIWFMTNTCKILDIPINLNITLCTGLISKRQHAKLTW